MNKSQQKIAADILVKAGIGDNILSPYSDGDDIEIHLFGSDFVYERVRPFKDNLPGRHQLDAIYDWLWEYEEELMTKAMDAYADKPLHKYSVRAEIVWTVRYCLEQLEKRRDE